MTLYRGSEIITEFLVKAKIPYLIGIPGHTTLDFLDAVYDRQDQIEPILVRHEAVGSFMADGYFRVRHKPIAVYAHSSPGAANLLLGVANAFLDSSSMLVFTGNVFTPFQGRGAYQEVTRKDIDAELISFLRPAVKYTWEVNEGDVKRLPKILARAYSLAISGRPGPVHIDVTQDAFIKRVDTEIPDPTKHMPTGRIRGDANAVNEAAELLAKAEEPAMLVGGGALISGATPELIQLAEMLDAPVATTIMGKSSFPETHKLSVGISGTWGTGPANKTMKEADVLLALGTRFTETNTSGWLPDRTFNIPPTKLIHIDIDPSEIGKYYPTEIGIVGDVKSVLRDLIDRLSGLVVKERELPWVKKALKSMDEWRKASEKLREIGSKAINPGRIIKEMRDLLPEDAIVVTDCGNHAKWVAQQFLTSIPGTAIGTMGFGSMGFGVCASLGVKLAAPDRTVICVCGDGGFTMFPQALTTAVEYDIPVIFCIFNDFALSAVRVGQMGPYKGRVIMTEFRNRKTKEFYNPDFVKIAEAHGAAGELIDYPKEFRTAFSRALKAEAPYLLDIRIDKDAKLPPGGGAFFIPTPK